MKLIKHGILLMLALCIFMLGANVILVQAIGDDEIKAVSGANQIENYDLKRVLKIKNENEKDENNYILHYEHKKTGAQLICFINLDYDNLEIAYRVPPENDNGIPHALEHCCFDDMVIQPEDSIDVDFEAYTGKFGLLFRTCFLNGNFENLNFLINSLKNNKILSNENIFKKQVFNQIKSNDGTILNRGRMFIEMMQNDKYMHSVHADKIYNYEIINHGNKLKFEPGGIPENIPNCSYNDICDAYNKYIHPSNSLIVIRSKQFKDVMANLDKDFLNYYDKKNIDVDYKLPQNNNGEFFQQYNVGGLKNIFSENYDYCGVAIYPLKGVKNNKISTFKNLCNEINSKQFQNKLIDMGYNELKAELCESIGCLCLRVAVAGNDVKNFDKDILNKNFERILKDAINSYDNSYDSEKTGFKNIAVDIFMASYVICGDPFGDRFFTIKDNEIIDCEEDPGIDKNLCLEVLKPEKTVLLKNDKITIYSENMDCRYQISFANNDKEMIRLAMRILNRGFVSKELQREGSVYRNMYTKSEAHDERCCCFYSDEMVAFDNITDFFKNHFNEKVKNFVVSDKLFNLVRKNIISNACYLEAVCPPEYYGTESVVKEEVFDKEYSLRNPETKRDISQISKQEIQDFIRTAKFIGYAIVK